MSAVGEDAKAPMTAQLLRRLLLGALSLGFLALVGVSAATAWLVTRDQDYTSWVDHTYVVERHLSQFAVLYERAEAARRGFFLTRQAQYIDNYNEAAKELPRQLALIHKLTRDNPHQQQNSAELQSLLDEKLKGVDLSMTPGAAARVMPTVSVRDQFLVDRTRSLLSRMVDEENRLLIIRTHKQHANADMLLVTVLGSGAVIAMLAVGSGLVVRRYAADLGRSQRALTRLNSGLETAVRSRTADLTRANEEIQRFAYIVSHDLRSPLVNVMGFTSELEVALKPLQKLLGDAEQAAPQLVTHDAREAVKTDLPEAIGFIRSSTKKMDRLINAILKLSREGRRTLSPEPVDMDALAQGVAASLKHQADERGAEIQVEATLPDLVSDRLAVEQVVSNLVENALKYLEPGRPGRIVVRGREDGPRRLYEVQDNGRGIAPNDHERIFELFRRSGLQDQPGEGIGLAHVRALTYRLGGVITVDSALDRGSTFRLSLPAKITRDEGPIA